MSDWIRDEDGTPKKMKTGGYVIMKEHGICFGVKPEDIDGLMILLDELKNELGIDALCDAINNP